MTDVEKQQPEEIKSRKDRPTGSMHVGDADFDPEDPAFALDATWGEVLRACCVHTPEEWAWVFVGICGVCFFLYFFMVGLDFISTGAKVMSACAAGALFGDETNPIAGLMIGILVTALLQSSSTTTSLIVALAGAGSVSVRQAIYMVMGANIGTSVTNTIVAMGHLGDGDQLERAFAGATVHDMFNFMTVAILLPVEAATGYLYYLTKAMVKNFQGNDGEEWEGPVKKWVDPLGNLVLIENKDVPKTVAKGGSCDEFYPIVCEDLNNPTKSTCSQVGLIGCDKSTDKCPAFFDAYADRHDDTISGVVVFIIGLVMLFTCLLGLVSILQKLLLGQSTRIIYKATNVNGYVAIVIGCGITVLVQSSSITTSVLTPLVGMGVLRLEQMFPLTLGANLGTTITGLLAALLSDANAMQVALAHLFFNVTGTVIFYPIPFMRNIPLHAARQLGKATRIWKGFPVVYVIFMFFVMPLILLGLSVLFMQGTKGLTVLGSMLVALLFLFLIWLAYYCQYKGGKKRCYDCMVKRQERREVMESLPEDMVYLKKMISGLADHTGYTVEEEEEAAEDEKKIETEKQDDSEEAEAPASADEEAA